MTSAKIIGLNTKWYRYQKKLTQEKFAELTPFKVAYISTIETGEANLTCRNIDVIAESLNVHPQALFNPDTATQAKELPIRIDMYKN